MTQTPAPNPPSHGQAGIGLSVMQKLLGIVALCVAFTLATGGVAVWQLARIGAEMESIVEADMPITNAVTLMLEHQLEQAILVERVARLATGDARLDETVKALQAITPKIDEEIRDAERQAKNAIRDASTPEQRAEYETVLRDLERIELAYGAVAAQIGEIVAAATQGRASDVERLIDQVVAAEERFQHELSALEAQLRHYMATALEAAYEHEQAAVLQMSILSALSALLGFGLAYWIIRAQISTPLSEVVRALNRLAEGDTTVNVQVRSRDEIGRVALAFQTFKERTLELKRLEAEKVEQERRAEAEQKRAMNALADQFEASVGAIVELVSSAATELEAAAQTLNVTLEETNAQAGTVAAAATQASANVETVATACEELAASVREIGQQVGRSSDISGRAVSNAEETQATAEGLLASTQKIGEVVKLITAIAEQTNLLALNATIEAARAGEAGKGFAVVASEVKNLATQTAKATDDITSQIGDVQSVSQRTVNAIKEIAQVIGESREIAASIASAVEQQDAATQEIARNVQQASAGTGEVSGAIAQVSQAASEGGSAATQVLSSAQELSRSAGTLRQEVTAFVAKVRAA